MMLTDLDKYILVLGVMESWILKVAVFKDKGDKHTLPKLKYYKSLAGALTNWLKKSLLDVEFCCFSCG